MFEYWFHGLKDSEDPFGGEPFVYAGATNDFLELVSRIGLYYDENEAAGNFVGELLTKFNRDLDHLRMIDWKFEYEWGACHEPKKKIVVHYNPNP